jgi:hypothetical protein
MPSNTSVRAQSMVSLTLGAFFRSSVRMLRTMRAIWSARLDFDAVDFVDQQHHRLVGRDGLEQRAGEEELIGEDVVVDVAPRVAVLVGLDAQQLLLVVPLVEGLGLVEAFVALQADQPGPRHLGDALRELGLPRTSRALDQHGLAEAFSEEHDARDAFISKVRDIAQTIAHGLDGLETGCHTQRTLLVTPAR